MPGRWLRLGVWTCFAVLLIVALFRITDASLAQLASELLKAPLWMWGGVITVNGLMVLIGALKWRLVRNWVSPDSTHVGLQTLGAVTAMGSLASFLLPPQPAHMLVRWWVFKRKAIPDPGVLGSTFFEQVYDLFVYSYAAVLAVLFLLAGLSGGVLAIAILAGVLFCLLSTKGFMALLTKLLGVIAKLRASDRFREPIEDAARIFRRAAELPLPLALRLMFLSILLLAGRITTVLLIAHVVLPGINMFLVAVGLPAIALLSVLPLTPAGLGVAEWSWSALLVYAGAKAPEAAISALAFRVVNIVALVLILPIFFVGRWAQK